MAAMDVDCAESVASNMREVIAERRIMGVGDASHTNKTESTIPRNDI